ncbi:7-cyano-7-deazaguanine synthase [Goodfellowiella coeruleoviolacea]|uniref:7-cyano-7-deazaguanine synthase n=1 Tax=Goodfellowiella coeruleoviolacea TaxID=334858 RepID=UPI000B169C24|nr:7-cyano-7-deazaguanine synthase [Goodfellowiella coeruleoviolacea]
MIGSAHPAEPPCCLADPTPGAPLAAPCPPCSYWLAHRGCRLSLLSFDYGQRHRVELDQAATIAGLLDCPHEIIDLTSVGRLLGGSALTDTSVAVPDGHYTDESRRATVVPNRNAIMLDVAVAIARRADAVAFGAHAGDHTIYPDCRPAFVDHPGPATGARSCTAARAGPARSAAKRSPTTASPTPRPTGRCDEKEHITTTSKKPATPGGPERGRRSPGHGSRVWGVRTVRRGRRIVPAAQAPAR